VTSGYHTGKLGLHGGREIRVFDIAINWRLRSKHGIKVGDILICRFVSCSDLVDWKDAYHRTSHARFERRLDFLRRKLPKVDMFVEEGVPFDFISPVDTKATRRVSVQQASKNAPRLCAELRPKHQRVIEDLGIHLVRHLYPPVSIATS
jgi:hypothetical protein